MRRLSARRSGFREVLVPAVRHVMVIGVALAVFQQITGINTIIYCAPTLLSAAGLGNSAALLANVVNGAVNVAMTIVAIRLPDRAGRRPLLLGGTTGMAAGMIVATMANWGANFVVTISFLTLLSALGNAGTSSCSPACPSSRWPTSNGRCRRPKTAACKTSN